MKRTETGIVMDILTAAYPKFYSGISAAEQRKVVSLWADMFSEDPVELVAFAVKALIATDDKGFPPHIGAVKAKLRQITAPPQMEPQEAWALVWKAIQRSGYNAQEEFRKLPPMLRRLVGDPAQLKAWSAMDADTVQSVVASNFQRSYQGRARQEAEFQALPADVKKLVGSMGKRLALEGSHDSV